MSDLILKLYFTNLFYIKETRKSYTCFIGREGLISKFELWLVFKVSESASKTGYATLCVAVLVQTTAVAEGVKQYVQSFHLRKMAPPIA